MEEGEILESTHGVLKQGKPRRCVRPVDEFMEILGLRIVQTTIH